MTAAVLNPGETIAAAMRELYDQLREIVDRGPPTARVYSTSSAS